MYCLSLKNAHLDKIKKLNYIPVGLGIDEFNEQWTRDNTGMNISYKNKFYGEYTFHYWFWKNQLMKENNRDWTGFCAYRRFWLKKDVEPLKIIDLNNDVLKEVPNDWEKFDTILGTKIDLTNLK